MNKYLLSKKTMFRGLLTAFFSFAAVVLYAQQLYTSYTVQKGETLFAIAKRYGVTVEDITQANPVMKEPEYVLKVGTSINIPSAAKAVNSKTVTVGVMLPLHDINGDGRRMVEYYRGMLLALNELKREGVSVEMNVWNVPEDGNVDEVLANNKAAKCDVIFGPLYTKQVPQMAQFCQEHNIRLVIPFSISGTDVQYYPCIYQVYQRPADIYDKSVNDFVALFKDAHPVFIDCNDASSNKGVFTASLRLQLDKAGVRYSITNLKNDAALFAKAFVTDKKNVVVLNTGRSPELGQAIKALDQLTAANPSIQVSLFGYNEWFMYAKVYQDKFKKYNAYVPSVYDYNASSSSVQNIEKLYAAYFGQPMQQAIPRFALTGYDQLMFFVKGIREYGVQFHGLASQNRYKAVQTPYSFEKVANGGYQNRMFMLVQYK